MSIQLNRNYGSMATAREFWGGNNGFITIVLNLPTAVLSAPVAEAAVRDGSATAAQIIEASNAERNLFKLAQAIGQRAVVVAISEVEAGVDATAVTTTVGGNVLAAATSGTPATGAVAVTFLIERADVFTAQPQKPGTNGAGNYVVDACQELADNLAYIDFEDAAATQVPTGELLAGVREKAAGVVVKVFDALPVLK